MSYLFNILLLAVAIVLASPVDASGVFKCTEADGTTTFSFTPCADPEPETAVEDGEQEPAVSKKV